MKVKKVIIILIIILSSVTLCSCWDYQEVDDMLLITAVGIEKDKTSGNYLLTVEGIKVQGGQETEIISNVTEMQGETIFDAVRNFIMRNGKRLYWAHAKAIVISEDVAKEGLIPVIDFINRDAEVRSDMWIMISKGYSPSEILHTETKIYELVGFAINEALKSEGDITKYVKIQLWQFISDLRSEGISPVLPVVDLWAPNVSENIHMHGTSIFKGDKLKGYLNNNESRYYMFVIGEAKGGLISMKNVLDTGTNVTLELFSNKTKIEPIIDDDGIMMNIDVKLQVEIAEIMGSEDFISKEGREKLKKYSENFVKKNIESVIKKVQKEYASDIFGFGRIIHKQKPKEWKKLKENWYQTFSSLDVEVNVDIKITASALTSKPIKMGD